MLKFLRVVAVLLLTSEVAYGEDLTTLMKTCAPSVHPTTLGAIVKTESSGNMYVLTDSGPKHLPWAERKSMVRDYYPATAEEAAAVAHQLIDSGHLVDIGLTQVNSENLPKLGLSVEQVLDPCVNLNTGGRVLTDFYRNARKQYSNEQDALMAAISAYNTGNFESGFENGYVARVAANAGVVVPELKAGRVRPAPGGNGVRALRGYQAPRRTSELLQAKFAELDVVFH
jgi:type IV secretion system protein VirB1